MHSQIVRTRHRGSLAPRAALALLVGALAVGACSSKSDQKSGQTASADSARKFPLDSADSANAKGLTTAGGDVAAKADSGVPAAGGPVTAKAAAGGPTNAAKDTVGGKGAL